MKVNLDDIRLGISAFGDQAQVGIPDKKRPNIWKHKKEIHNDFIHAVVTFWQGKEEVVSVPGADHEFVISVIKRKKAARKKTKPAKKVK